MAETLNIHVLLVEDSAETIRLISAYLKSYPDSNFIVSAVTDGESALNEVELNPAFDLILMDYYLPDMNGLEVARRLMERRVRIPVVFLTVRKDVEMAVEVMRIGGRDFIVKEDVERHVFPQTLVTIYERHRLETEVEQLEIRRGRLEALQEMIVDVTKQLSGPIATMKTIMTTLHAGKAPEKADRYVTLILDNLNRIEGKIEKLRNLKEDKTVKYIKDIKMIDLS